MTDQENTPKAILLIILGMSVFAVQDALIKSMTLETNIFLIYFMTFTNTELVICRANIAFKYSLFL